MVGVGEEGGIWVWDMNKTKEEIEKEGKGKEKEREGKEGEKGGGEGGELVAAHFLDLSWGIKSIFVDHDEFWIGSGRFVVGVVGVVELKL